MTIYNIYIFNQAGLCLYYGEWNRLRGSGMSQEEEAKLMYGMIYSLKSFVTKISPVDCKDGFLNFKTNKYKLNFYETPSGLKFILNTDINSANGDELLRNVYKNVYVEYVVKNPECQPNQPIDSLLFKERLDQFIRKSDLFA